MVWLGRTVTERFQDATSAGSIAESVSSAVRAAVKAHRYEQALEWLEEGRSIVWGQLFQLRTPVDDLESTHSDLATKFRQIAAQLDKASTGSVTIANSGTRSLESEAQAHRRLAESWDRTLTEIRLLNGFEDFLRAAPFRKLSKASEQGIIVVLNLHQDSCDALIIPHGSTAIINISLANFTNDTAVSLRDRMERTLLDANVRTRGSRQGRPGYLERILAVLWTHVVQPVFQALALRHLDVSSLTSQGLILRTH
jgi:hypothetical protein